MNEVHLSTDLNGGVDIIAWDDFAVDFGIHQIGNHLSRIHFERILENHQPKKGQVIFYVLAQEVLRICFFWNFFVPHAQDSESLEGILGEDVLVIGRKMLAEILEFFRGA